MKGLVKRLLNTIGIVLLCTGLQAQSLDQAKKLYNEGQYEEAKPAFERLVKQAPNNSSYNHWYGVCCFETGDLETAQIHLEFAVKRKVQESYRYLGELYYLTYHFEKSIEMFDEYIALLTKKKQDIEAFDIRRSQASNALRMLERVEDIQVIDSIVVNKDDFLSTYYLSEECGTLSTYQDFFKTSSPVESVVHMNQKGDKIYYGEETDENRFCLFNQSKLLDHWGDEKQLPMNINTNNDDNYPFVLSDGVTVYYASKGMNSLGGYDMFVTRYNTNSDTYLTPEQLGMPFNSPFNDYMMVIDEAKGLGWFVSDRFQPEGKVCVYLYILNNNRERIDSEDVEFKRNRAMLSSIADSWKENADYTELVKLAYTEIPYGKVEIQKDFEFAINNNIVYYTLDEIKSPEARSHYEKVVSINKQIKEVKEKLNELRTEYTQGNSSRREQLKPTILNTEEQLNTLLAQPAEWEKKARNAEINFLKTNR